MIEQSKWGELGGSMGRAVIRVPIFMGIVALNWWIMQKIGMPDLLTGVIIGFLCGDFFGENG